MLTKLGEKFTDVFQKYMPSAFVFALLLTIIAVLSAFMWMEASPIQIISAWYDGFFDLLSFGMQIVLIIITGFSIALSSTINKGIDRLAVYIKTPKQVYFFVILIGSLLSLVSFGWIVITCVLARELAMRVKGVNYPFLIACAYFSFGGWVSGLSSSIPLLLNTENNFLIEAEILSSKIPTAYTLGSVLNIAMIVLFVIIAPLLFLVFIPKQTKGKELKDLLKSGNQPKEATIKDEAESFKLPVKAVSDTLNNTFVLPLIIAAMGFTYIVYHFYTNGFDLNFNIMIFIFLMIGLFLHKTPMRYSIAMKRASSNISGILFQYPFYAGIMGIMLYTGVGEKLADALVSIMTIDTYPFFAYLTGGVVNFAIPSAGGEFAVVGPSIIEAVKNIGAGLPQEQVTAMVSRASLSVAYGESLSNMLQPFFILLVLPVMGAGVKLQSRDIMGYLVLPFIIFFIIQSLMVLYIPL
ncbi:short-chain fatty acid transporter [Ichthyenterobacterium magnum]|uniref:Short-chain fatty acids transporter n=1 Tax=Ichthyenterobacterium magnum TaxID=1230530 RepID=A0A420DL86_9FLAO|nr:TIGR00366 family protein [Ichthyenterobacterium magnum]RKE94960.1 short-chain fatty acids transporter [Ichthyenterobacterium magnum]